jgi:membrane associated rhomboid family serine protease
VLAPYLVFYPASRITTWAPIGRFYHLTLVRAAIVLGFWFFDQLFEGVMTFGGADLSGVAVWAHVGGVIAGVLMALLLPNERRRQIAYAW